MANLPNSRTQRLNWLETRIGAWLDNASQIGLAVDLVGDLQSKITAARAALENRESLKAQAEAATLLWHQNIDDTGELAAAAIAATKGFAKTSGNPAVYALAQISPGSPPTPAGAPEVPGDMTTEVLNRGAVEIRWKGTLAFRTYYEVLRRLPGEGVEKMIASIGKLRFIDDTLPSGPSRVWYAVRARRGELASDMTDPVEVRLGIPGEGGDTLAIAA
jgi:hypothetical protein